MTRDKNALTDGVIADLLWKLRLRLDAEGKENIDIHQLRKDATYRERWLAHAAISSDPELKNLSAAIRQRLLELSGEGGEKSPVSGGATKKTGNRKLYWLGAAALVVAAAGIFFFTGSAPTPGVPSPAAAVPAAQKSTVAGNAGQPARTLFRLHGSNTLGEKLAPALVEDYFASIGATGIATKPTGAPLETRIEAQINGENVAVEIHAHGSSTAFADLEAGTTDIGMSSRRIKDEEIEKLKPALGDLSQASAEHVIGLDGLAVVVNPGLPVEALTVQQVASIFAGEITNWQQLGGPDLPVALFARDDNSGTWDSFDNMALKPYAKTLSAAASRIESSQELSDAVFATQGAIGFIGLPYVRQAKLIAVSGDDASLAFFPTEFTVSTEDYVLSRRLYLYLPPAATNSEARKFIDHVHGSNGQSVVADIGFISQNITASRPPLADDLPYDYLQLVENARRLSVNIRFAPGSDSIDNKGRRDLQRLVHFMRSNPGSRVLLMGFTDSLGSPETNLALSRARAELVSRELAKFGISPFRVTGFGAAAPVASNDNDEGRNRNRRVEVWVI